MRVDVAAGTRVALAVAALGLSSACGHSVDLVSGLRIEGISTGWLDAGPSQGLNKLAPTVSLTLTNISDRPLPTLQVNAVFRRAGETAEWGARFASAADSTGLAPGQSTRRLVLTSELGYTGGDAVDEMLRNTRFVDAAVDVFAKYGSTQWVRLGRYPIERHLLVPPGSQTPPERLPSLP